MPDTLPDESVLVRKIAEAIKHSDDAWPAWIKEARAALSVLRPYMRGWQDISTAPKDGTRILIWFVHQNAQFSEDPVGEGWEAAHEACWIDHNGGGWTWHGLCGTATYWQPLPPPPSKNRRKPPFSVTAHP